MRLVQDKGKMRISYEAQVRAILFTNAKTYKQKITAPPILLTRQVVLFQQRARPLNSRKMKNLNCFKWSALYLHLFKEF